MRIQLLSDLHLETEAFEPEPNPAAELLVLGGDIDSRWDALERFRDWPVPVWMVAGNHEFDGRDLDAAWPALRERCAQLGIVLLERESRVATDAAGARVRIVATVRWCDFDLFGDRSVMILATPGHTQGHQSMKVKLPSTGTVIISQDAIWMQENLDGYPAGLNYSVQDYTNSVNRLKHMRDLEGAQIFMAHDGDQFKSKGSRWYK